MSSAVNSSATLRVKVARKATEAEGIASFDLVSADGSALPRFTAGAHIDVHLAGGLLRQYSLCNSPAETHRYQLAVLREPASRGGSQAMHEQVHEGDVLTISAPRNQFALQPRADKHLLLAGGIGITPIKAMAEALAVARLPFALHYAARSASRMAFADALTAAPWGAQVALHRDDGPDEQRLDLPRLLADPAPGCHLYVCGPTGFIDAVMSTARAQGWPDDHLHCEHFGAAPLIAEGDQPFEVQIASSGRVIPIAAGQRITDALSAAGVFVSTSCEQGVCGTCLTRVISGVPEHHDTYLLPEEQAANDQCLPCCARSRSARLVLDL